MLRFNRRLLLAGGIGLGVRNVENQSHYLFATAEYKIALTLEYHDQQASRRLGFLDTSANRHFCLSSSGEENKNCVTDFKGAIAVARYKLIPRTAPRASLSLREYVRNIDQSERVPVRAPFERIIRVEGGLASDIQVFGYQDSSLAQGEKDDAWCLLRQNLYLGDNAAPFLVLHWKHTLDRIRVLDIIPGSGTEQMTRGDQ